MNIRNNSMVPLIIKGGYHTDNRGTLSFVNDFSLKKIKRFYIIKNRNIDVVRAWQGHKKQPKYFHVVSGSFWIACVKIDNWLQPSKNLKPEIFKLDCDNQISVLFIPPGFANGIKAIKKESKLISFCEDELNEYPEDNYRYDQNMWLDWNNLKPTI